MGWTVPTVRATGYLVTASDWNTDLVDNLKYLKGLGGPVYVQDQIYALSIYSGGKYSVPPNVREMRYVWEFKPDLSGVPTVDYQVTRVVGGAGLDSGNIAYAEPGSGQMALQVNENHQTWAEQYQKEATTPAGWAVGPKSNVWTVTKNPYFRQEFCVNNIVASLDVGLGLMQTPGIHVLPPNTQNFAMLIHSIGHWYLQCCEGGGGAYGQSAALDAYITANTRHVVEIYITSATSVECWIDGVLRATVTTHLPTGTLLWSHILYSSGAGAATDDIMTLGELVMQEITP